MSKLRLLLIVSVIWLLPNNPAFSNRHDPPGAFVVCFDFSCKSHEQVSLTKSDWERVVQFFVPAPQTAQDERLRLLDAVAEMETVVGNYTPTHRDVGRNSSYDNNSLSGLPGQMDCIDESVNTTTYLQLMQNKGLLKFHLVRDRAYRRSWLSQHWAAQIIETQSSQHYVIDSWFEDNGELPLLVKGEVWHDLSVF